MEFYWGIYVFGSKQKLKKCECLPFLTYCFSLNLLFISVSRSQTNIFYYTLTVIEKIVIERKQKWIISVAPSKIKVKNLIMSS